MNYLIFFKDAISITKDHTTNLSPIPRIHRFLCLILFPTWLALDDLNWFDDMLWWIFWILHDLTTFFINFLGSQAVFPGPQGGQPCSAPGTPGPLGAAGAQRLELGAGVHFVAATWWICGLIRVDGRFVQNWLMEDWRIMEDLTWSNHSENIRIDGLVENWWRQFGEFYAFMEDLWGLMRGFMGIWGFRMVDKLIIAQFLWHLLTMWEKISDKI